MNYNLAKFYQEEWLFYQGQAWQEEEEELNKFNKKKWSRCPKTNPKKLWSMLDWKVLQTIDSPNIIHRCFDNIFNAEKMVIPK